MRATAGVIKKNQVRMVDVLSRPTGPVAAAGGAAPAKSAPAGGQPAARLMRSDTAGALLEVTCPCGCTTYIQCDYALARGEDARPTKQGEAT